MVPRLVFAALVFCSLASRPEGAAARRHVQVQPAPAPATLGPPALAVPACR